MSVLSCQWEVKIAITSRDRLSELSRQPGSASAPGSPTKDKPLVTFVSPPDRNSVIGELTIRVPDCSAAYEVLRSRGAEFITPPVEWGDKIRAFFHDPDGHLLEISQSGQQQSEAGEHV